MSSPLRIYYSQPAPGSTEEDELPEETELPVANSFARTLRAFAEKQQPVVSNPAQLSVVAEPKTKRPRVVGSPLTMGGAAVQVEAPEVEAEEAAPAPEDKPKQPKAAQGGLLLRAWAWLQKNNKFAVAKQLRVSETISLGEKRFVALVDIDGQKFLIGGGASGVSLLTSLRTGDSPAEAMQLAAAAAGQLK
jgi:hypothetical protein